MKPCSEDPAHFLGISCSGRDSGNRSLRGAGLLGSRSTGRSPLGSLSQLQPRRSGKSWPWQTTGLVLAAALSWQRLREGHGAVSAPGVHLWKSEKEPLEPGGCHTDRAPARASLAEPCQEHPRAVPSPSAVGGFLCWLLLPAWPLPDPCHPCLKPSDPSWCPGAGSRAGLTPPSHSRPVAVSSSEAGTTEAGLQGGCSGCSPQAGVLPALLQGIPAEPSQPQNLPA